MKRNSNKENSTKSGSTKARTLMNKMMTVPDWHTLYVPTRKAQCSRPHSSPSSVCPKNSVQSMLRPSSSPSAAENPVLSFLDIKRILFQKINDRKDELRKAFQLLDAGRSLTVTKGELKRVIGTFLLPLTREQFQDLLAQIPLTGSGNVPYLEFLSKFGGSDLNINVIKRGGGHEMDSCRTLKELEIQIGEKVFRNPKAVIKAFRLLDVSSTGRVQPQQLRRVLETFCLQMTEEEYQKFSKHYGIDKDTAVDYGVFLKNLSKSNDVHLRYFMGNQEVSPENPQARTLKREHWLSSTPSEESWGGYSLDDIEKAFCREFSKSIDKIEKALSAGDPSRGGYVSLNYLKVVLDTFVCRLPRRLFLQLMKRFGFKTTARINWKQFLTSYYELQGLEASNTVPPLKRDSTHSRSRSRRENAVTKLLRRAEASSEPLRKALLMSSSTKPGGRMTGDELRQILSATLVKVSDSEFRELMRTLDPEATGVVTAGSFLDLLEASPKTRKTSPCTGAKTPLPLAWVSVEAMVHDAIAKNLQAFCNMLQSYDLRDTGLMAQSNFKAVMHVFCPFLTHKHLKKLCCKFQDPTSEKILYKKLLACIRVSGSPTVSPKDQPCGHFQKEEGQFSGRTKPTRDRTPTIKNMTRDEAIENLKSRIKRQDPVFRKRFLEVSGGLLGKIGLRDFKKVLEDSGMPMDEVQYSLLATKIGFRKEGMSYLDFAVGFEDAGGPAVTPPHTPAASKSSLIGHFVTAEECLKLFPKRLRESFRDPYSAFFKIDTDRDGIISMRDLHRLLQQLLFNLKDEEFERLLGLLGLRLSVTLNFREFQSLCEKGPSPMDEAPQRLLRPKQKVADSELACEQAHQYLVIKAKTRWTDLSKNFIETDTEGNGILRRRDIKNALYGFDIPLTPREFEKLWQSYDTEGRGYITYQEFLQKLGINYSPTVHRPYAEDYFNFLGHFTKPQQVQEEIQELQQSTERAKPARNLLVDHVQDIGKALSTLDKCQLGSVSLHKMQQVLQECGCPLQEEELAALLNSLGIICHDNTINYLDFLRALESSKAARPQREEKEDAVPINFSTLNPEEVVKSVQEVVSTSQQALSQAFSALDKEDTGFVKATDFGQVLKDFCHKLTDSQYHLFLRKLRIHLTPSIHWKYFLETFGCFLEEAADEWAERMPRVPPPTSPREAAIAELLARLQKAVTTHHYAFAQEFKNFDTNKSNTVSRDEFRAVCTHHLQILTDKQFDRLWGEMPVTARGRLKYQEFLSRFGVEQVASPPATGDSVQAQKGSSVPQVSNRTQSAISSPTRDLRAELKSRSHPCTPAGDLPLQNCEPVESRLRKQVQGCWRALLKDCKEKDLARLGTIAAPDFLALVQQFRLDLSKEESQQLLTKYDLKNNGTFAYCDFIQNCVLLLRATETSLMRRLKIQNTHKMKEAGAESCSFYAALLRIQPKILHCWRPMRRMFKAYDQGGTGILSADDFRKVLRQFSINLSEEEFFHLLEYYDKTLSSKVSYNDFLRAFLQ
nr:EF-hand calcium-binding domain-containing protein 6 [Cavia porcellus]